MEKIGLVRKIKGRDDDKIHITLTGKGSELSSKPNRRKITMIFYLIHKLQLDLFPSFSTMPMAMSFLISHALATAKKMIDAVEPEAKNSGWQWLIAIVDAGENLVAFGCMDNAMLASIQHAMDKHLPFHAARSLRKPCAILCNPGIFPRYFSMSV